MSLQAALKENDLSAVPAFAASIIMIAIFRRALIHMRTCLARPIGETVGYDFWNRQRSIEETLLHTTSALGYIPGERCPDSSRLFVGFLNQTTLLCLHKAAAIRATTTKLPPAMAMESEKRCTDSAIELANLIKATPENDPCFWVSI